MFIIAINFIIDLTIIAIIVIITIIFNVNDCRFCVFRQAAISYFSGGIHSKTYMKAIALKKSSQIQCGRASIFDITPRHVREAPC